MKKSNGGQPNFSGVNAQAWASMSLFLQFLRDPKFTHIHLEAPNFQDFNLVFDDGKKIICESKNRKEKFNYSHLKEILKNISKGKSIADQDEILIICSNVNSRLVSDIKNLKYYGQIKIKFKKKGFDDENLALLSKVKFWVVPATFNEKVIYGLFADLVNFWLPPNDLERIVDHILIQKIYKGSAKGSTYSKIDILKEIGDLATEAKNNSVFYKDNLEKREKQFSRLNKALNNPSHPTWTTPKELSAFSTDYERLRFATSRLSDKKDCLNLKKWDPILQLNRVYSFSFAVFHILENNLYTDPNRKYALEYIKRYTKTIRGFYRSDFFDVNSVKIVTKIIDSKNGKKYLEDAYTIVKDLLTFNEKDFFYLKNDSFDRGEWEKDQVCQLLHKIYNLSNSGLKQNIFDLIINTFNITEDEGEFSFHAPKEVFSILNDWLLEGFQKKDFLRRFSKLVKIAGDQYDKFYKKFSSKVEFKGWEHMGGGVSFSGGYRAYDRHFVGILSVAIKKYYDQDPVRAWQFIKNKCVLPEKKVNKKHPDFLNRATYQIVIDRYENSDTQISKESFSILKEMILTKRGIPHKSDLIYQSVAQSAKLSTEKKWKLVELTTKKYNVPVNPFVEQIVTSLAKDGFVPAKQEMKKWFGSSDYYTKRFFLNLHDSIDSITQLLDSDFDFAVELFEAFIFSGYFGADKSDRLGGFTAAALLNKIFNRPLGYAKALPIINRLIGLTKLSESQQAVLCYSLFNSHGNDDSDDVVVLTNIYKEIVDPLLNGFDNDSKKVSLKITNPGSRSALVQFAGRLATKKKIGEALRIIKVFVNDPDPYLPGQDPNDKKNEYNEHYKIIKKGEGTHSITSVRGWCGWELMKCAVLDGRDYLRQTIDLTKTLCEDENYYVLHMACFALSQLAKNRLTVLPDKRDTLFFYDNVETALKMSKEVEDLAFQILERMKSAPENIQTNVQKALIKSVLQPFDSIRALSQEKSLYLVQTLANFPEETYDESAPLFIYYAEYRKDDYKNWKWARPGLYDDLQPWDSEPFEDLIKQIFTNTKDRKDLFKFAAVYEKSVRDASVGSVNEKEIAISLKYFKMLTDKYDHRVFTSLYMAINEAMGSKIDSREWYDLYIECLTTESKFYEDTLKNPANSKDETYRGMYWWPEMDNFEILEKIYKTYGLEDCLKAVSLITSFPKEFEIHETTSVIDLLKQNKGDTRAKKMLELLFNKNPSKYWGLKDLIK
jgi:hypothetical protein